MRVVVHYDASFARPGTWMMSDMGHAIRARFQLGNAEERVVDTELRWRLPSAQNVVHVTPIDAAMTTWVTEASNFAGQIGVLVVLQLNDAPEWIAQAMRTW
jgi:hypothetical protein